MVVRCCVIAVCGGGCCRAGMGAVCVVTHVCVCGGGGRGGPRPDRVLCRANCPRDTSTTARQIDTHWSEKPLEKMTERDWRIFRCGGHGVVGGDDGVRQAVACCRRGLLQAVACL
jgi:hypothetical protein